MKGTQLSHSSILIVAITRFLSIGSQATVLLTAVISPMMSTYSTVQIVGLIRGEGINELLGMIIVLIKQANKRCFTYADYGFNQADILQRI